MPLQLRSPISEFPYLRLKVQTGIFRASSEGGGADVDFASMPFAADPERAKLGWLAVSSSGRDWRPDQAGSPTPPSPGPGFKRSMSLLVYSPKVLGPEVHEWCDSSEAYANFAEDLWNKAEDRFGSGEVPVVRFTELRPIRVGRGTSMSLRFEFVRWIPRPDALDKARPARPAILAPTASFVTSGRQPLPRDGNDGLGGGAASAPPAKPVSGPRPQSFPADDGLGGLAPPLAGPNESLDDIGREPAPTPTEKMEASAPPPVSVTRVALTDLLSDDGLPDGL